MDFPEVVNLCSDVHRRLLAELQVAHEAVTQRAHGDGRAPL
jgi:hypothetical protein